MSQDSMRALVETRIGAFMAANYPAVPVKYENVPFNQPDGTFVAVHIMEGESFRANLGRTWVKRCPGMIQFDVMHPKDQGTAVPRQLASAIGKHFEERDFQLVDGDRLTLRVASLPKAPEASGFYRLMCRINYFRDETTEG